MRPKILIVDLGSQYTQLIAGKVRELNVYCEIVTYDKMEMATDSSVIGVIMSDSGVITADSKTLKVNMNHINVPILGIGYSADMMLVDKGARAQHIDTKDPHKAIMKVAKISDLLLKNIKNESTVWLSRGEQITEIPEEINVTACDENNAVLAFNVNNRKWYGVRFHPEVYHCEQGLALLKNFVVDICEAQTNWTPSAYIEMAIKDIKTQLGDDKVLLGLSGGVDSSVAAELLNKAIGSNLICIFVDTGLMRKNEYEQVMNSYDKMGLNVIGVRAGEKFLGDLKGVIDPEQKRKIIGRDFIEVFDNQASKLNDIKWLAQGTIYPDIIESVSENGTVAVKSHHNVGGLPEKMNLKIVEPLKWLFKDEVRRIGRELKVPENILNRHPFPGPGLGIRILGEVTPERVRILQEADQIFIDGLKKHGLYGNVWQAGVILLPIQSVGVSANKRTYESCVALRAVNSVDGMTADWINLPCEFLAEMSNEIISNVVGVNRVVYDISSKPPATIEWE